MNKKESINKGSAPCNKKVFSLFKMTKSAEDSPQRHWGMTSYFMNKAFINKSSSRSVSVRDISGCVIPRTTTLRGDGGVRAFTLIELLVVVLIIGILAAVALPQYQKTVWKSRAMELIIAAKAISDQQHAYYLANGVYAEMVEDIPIYPKDSLGRFTIGEDGVCSLIYSNTAPPRVSCSLPKPYLTIQRFYKSGKLQCCTYSYDNYAADGVCQNLLNKTNWTNDCSEQNICHCYKE